MIAGPLKRGLIKNLRKEGQREPEERIEKRQRERPHAETDQICREQGLRLRSEGIARRHIMGRLAV
jgi:hypothetical protein